jgi:hypothetical protein
VIGALIQKYMELIEIKKQLDFGDQRFLAKATGYSTETVKKVLDGTRVNTKVMDAALFMIAGKRSMEEQIRIMLSEEAI